MVDLVGRTGHTCLRDLRGRGGWADYLDDCEIDGWRGGDRPGPIKYSVWYGIRSIRSNSHRFPITVSGNLCFDSSGSSKRIRGDENSNWRFSFSDLNAIR